MNGSPVIELTGLVKSFHSSKGVVPAVRGVDLSVRAGEIVALFGPNGAGKSTTIDMLLGLSQPDAGTVRVLVGLPEVATAIRYVAAGRPALDAGLAASAISEGESPLSPRELEVLAVAADKGWL